MSTGTAQEVPDLVSVRKDDLELLLKVCACYAPHPPTDDISETTIRTLAALKQVPRMSVQWAVAYGGSDLNDGSGIVELYDDEEDAREHLAYYKDGRVVKRTVLALLWEAVPGDVTAGDERPS